MIFIVFSRSELREENDTLYVTTHLKDLKDMFRIPRKSPYVYELLKVTDFGTVEFQHQLLSKKNTFFSIHYPFGREIEALELALHLEQQYKLKVTMIPLNPSQMTVFS